MTRDEAIERCEKAYMDECNKGRYATAMRVAIDRYEKLMVKTGRKIIKLDPEWMRE